MVHAHLTIYLHKGPSPLISIMKSFKMQYVNLRVSTSLYSLWLYHWGASAVLKLSSLTQCPDRSFMSTGNNSNDPQAKTEERRGGLYHWQWNTGRNSSKWKYQAMDSDLKRGKEMESYKFGKAAQHWPCVQDYFGEYSMIWGMEVWLLHSHWTSSDFCAQMRHALISLIIFVA